MLLALDTSSIACSVALRLDDTVIERHAEQPREHTRILLPMIRAVLEESGAGIAALDAIVLGNGPGSFIGMRIAASVAQGLAFGSDLKIVPVSSMAAVAAAVFASHDAAEVVVTQDAHMHQVYLGIYGEGDGGLPVARHPERLCDQDAIAELATNASGRRLAAGFGWQRFPGLLGANRNRIDAVIEILHPRARDLLALGEAGLRAGTALDPKAIEPAYLRQKVAEKPSPAT